MEIEAILYKILFSTCIIAVARGNCIAQTYDLVDYYVNGTLSLYQINSDKMIKQLQEELKAYKQELYLLKQKIAAPQS